MKQCWSDVFEECGRRFYTRHDNLVSLAEQRGRVLALTRAKHVYRLHVRMKTPIASALQGDAP